MIGAETRAKVAEFLKWHTAEQAAVEFKLNRATVYNIRKGNAKKGLAFEAKRKEIVADCETMSVKEAAAKHGITRARVYAVLKREKGNGKRKAVEN